ncbi:MAG: hypothetical protein A3G32_01830 [Deltaproteobacteria bacterium RIFCSPLOWO2_12_FULL_40_28]|nr:MAG: hypothetical protein A3C45_06575 [Deltaproteobacteria bacterium RIFCSPHIGHO2_02_FULL_40_28]OGQ18870.1 MAG: hypothetical protein A3E27_09210 [Deltaproteobacteria bacterium RIFCSPHIGHO2_12_FULL_40_32]OGQ40115.1 MAG: hypothetical protein A3I69_01740 [Deltaproteobacteria bacterium RIFCSPLOWO2_02_FULL_40_36]OGQ53298.1 MAG: hypothetical protein A3G32_01830 [Deltaproteobacteria bacterium RIFCSPLOWO2_12_FULL_40_28]
MKKTLIIFLTLLILMPWYAEARSAKNKTVGVYGMGNIQLLGTEPEYAPGPGGGAYFDYRFNHRFSLTVDAWVTTHNGDDSSNGDDDIVLLGIPTATLKLYFIDDESSKWDPYAGIGLGVFALTEGSTANGTNGVGLGAQIDVGFDYHFTDIIALGFSGIFRSAGIIHNLDGGNNSATAIIPFSLVARLGFHF